MRLRLQSRLVGKMRMKSVFGNVRLEALTEQQWKPWVYSQAVSKPLMFSLGESVSKCSYVHSF